MSDYEDNMYGGSEFIVDDDNMYGGDSNNMYNDNVYGGSNSHYLSSQHQSLYNSISNKKLGGNKKLLNLIMLGGLVIVVLLVVLLLLPDNKSNKMPPRYRQNRSSKLAQSGCGSAVPSSVPNRLIFDKVLLSPQYFDASQQGLKYLNWG
jgi:hypothetical protein